jgi:hypothetical protein
MDKFFNILFIIIISYYVLKLIGRYLFPWIIKRQLNKMQQHFGNQQQQPQEPYKQKEGKVTVHYQQKDASGNKDRKGEYVDYEEVKD